MNTFETTGKKLDARVNDFKKKVREAVEGLDASLQSADRQGFERARKIFAEKARLAQVFSLAVTIEKVPYTDGK